MDSLIVRPGDTLLIFVCGHPSEGEFVRLRRELRADCGVPDSVKIVVLSGVEQLAIYRPEPELAEPPRRPTAHLWRDPRDPPGAEPLKLDPADVTAAYPPAPSADG